jgi:hypothetical protein
MLEATFFKIPLFYSFVDMEASRQQDGLSYEKWTVQGSRSRCLRSTGKATERQAAGKFRIARLVEFKLLSYDLLKYQASNPINENGLKICNPF